MRGLRRQQSLQTFPRRAPPREQLPWRQTMSASDLAGMDAFLITLRNNRRLFFRRPRAAAISPSKNLDTSWRSRLNLRHVLML